MKKDLFFKLIRFYFAADVAEKVEKVAEKMVPEYFYEIPSSSSGKYHPEDELGDGGLVLHTAKDLEMANTLMSLYNIEKYSRDYNIVMIALLFHDTFKSGSTNTGHTVHEHPILAANVFMACAEGLLDDIDVEVSGCIASHMGRWTTSKYSDIVLPAPSTRLEQIVHLADYMAARKNVSVNMESVLC